jgi:hypothetical protein
MAISIDISRGVDVMRRGKVLEHLEGADALERAKALARQGAGRYVRYWGVKPQKEGE